jgi:hypothetical protein
MFFVLGNFLLILLSLILFNLLFLLPIAVYIITLFIESLIKNKNITIAFLSIAASYAQLFGYGLGFIGELLTRKAGRKKQEELYK